MSIKHIILCLDRTPTMQSVQKFLKEGLKQFINTLKQQECGEDQFILTEISFGQSIRAPSQPVPLALYMVDDYPLDRKGKIRASEVLRTAVQHMENTWADWHYLVFVTDNSLDPTESMTDLDRIIGGLQERACLSCFTAGFKSEDQRGMQGLEALLQFFPGGRSRLLANQQECSAHFCQIAVCIAGHKPEPQLRVPEL